MNPRGLSFPPIVVLSALVLLGLLVVLAPPAGGSVLAQDSDGRVRDPAVPTVTVTGTGTATTVPDAATFTAGVEVVADDLATAQAEASERMTAVLETLRDAGVPDEAIQTVGFRVEVIHSDEQLPAPAVAAEPAATDPAPATPAPSAIQGFRVVNEVRVEVANVDRLGTLLDSVLAAGANTVSNVQLTAGDPSGAQRDARMRAIADARTAAEDLALAADAQLGEVVSIVMNGAAAPPQPVALEAQAAGGAVPIAPGQQEISVSVHVTYRLEPGGRAGHATPTMS